MKNIIIRCHKVRKNRPKQWLIPHEAQLSRLTSWLHRINNYIFRHFFRKSNFKRVIDALNLRTALSGSCLHKPITCIVFICKHWTAISRKFFFLQRWQWQSNGSFTILVDLRRLEMSQPRVYVRPTTCHSSQWSDTQVRLPRYASLALSFLDGSSALVPCIDSKRPLDIKFRRHYVVTNDDLNFQKKLTETVRKKLTGSIWKIICKTFSEIHINNICHSKSGLECSPLFFRFNTKIRVTRCSFIRYGIFVQFCKNDEAVYLPFWFWFWSCVPLTMSRLTTDM